MLENSERSGRKRSGGRKKEKGEEGERERRVACAVFAAKILFLQGEDRFVVLLL
jgi:hypothetical protein